MRINFKVISMIVLIGVVITILCGAYIITDLKTREEQTLDIINRRQELTAREEKLAGIKNNYNSIVKVLDNATIYKKDNDSYIEAGSINKDVIVELEQIANPSLENEYFKILDTDYYLSYDDVEKTDISNDKRYLNYLEFPLEITTDSNTIFYDKNGNELFSLDNPITAKVIINNENYYGIKLLSNLVYVKKESVNTTTELEDTNIDLIAKELPAILYHFIYLNGDPSCNETICHSEEQIDSHFKFLHDNDVFTLNTDEVLSFIKEEIRLPKKSILITIDDGARAENFIPFLEKYQLNATLFLVSSWYPVSKFSSPYLEIASHTHDMHTTGVCPTGQGGGINCLDEETILTDLKNSRATLNNTKAFCFPFFEYSDYSINLVKEAGFEMAFIGGGTKIKPGIDPYKIPRYTFFNNTSVDYLRRLVFT